MPGEVILDGDIEQILVDALPTLLAARGFTGVAVATKIRGADSVTLFRTGGPRGSLVSDVPQVTFDTRAATEGRASAIALMTRALVLSLKGDVLAGHQVYDVGEFTGPANLPDPNFTGARYRWNAFIHIRSHAL